MKVKVLDKCIFSGVKHMLTEVGVVHRTYWHEHVYFMGENLLPNPGNLSRDAVGQNCCVSTQTDRQDRQLKVKLDKKLRRK